MAQTPQLLTGWNVNIHFDKCLETWKYGMQSGVNMETHHLLIDETLFICCFYIIHE